MVWMGQSRRGFHHVLATRPLITQEWHAMACHSVSRDPGAGVRDTEVHVSIQGVIPSSRPRG